MSDKAPASIENQPWLPTMFIFRIRATVSSKVMLVSHRKKFIYLKTVKTASTSVESFFEPFCLPAGDWQRDVFCEESVSEAGVVGYRGLNNRRWFGLRRRRWFDHMSAYQVKKQVGRAIWDSYYKFCVIRNPFDKLVSAFYFFQEMENRGFHRMPVGPGPSQIDRFRKWVKVEVGDRRRVLDRQCYTIKGQVCVDFVVRYENLTDDLDKVCRQVDVPPELGELPNLVRGFRPEGEAIQDFYDDETRAVVERVFDFELEEFGYRFPG